MPRPAPHACSCASSAVSASWSSSFQVHDHGLNRESLALYHREYLRYLDHPGISQTIQCFRVEGGDREGQVGGGLDLDYLLTRQLLPGPDGCGPPRLISPEPVPLRLGHLWNLPSGPLLQRPRVAVEDLFLRSETAAAMTSSPLRRSAESIFSASSSKTRSQSTPVGLQDRPGRAAGTER